MNTQDIRLQSLAFMAGGVIPTIIPIGGEAENGTFAEIVYGSSGSIIRGASRDIKSKTPRRDAVLTITCYSHDPACRIMRRLMRAQDASPIYPLPGNANNAGTGENVSWDDAMILEEAPTRLGTGVETVSFTVGLSGATRPIQVAV